jgi:hypothetical protein
MVAERVDLKFEQQVWRNGLRLYGGETRAHCKGGLLLKAEVTTKSEIKKGSFLPEISMKLRLTDADIFYEKLVVDHTAGVDGDAANAIGEVLIDLTKTVKPEVEKELRDKEYMPDLMHQHLIDFIERHREGPFYAYYSLSHVHTEILPTPDSTPGSKDMYTDNIVYMDKFSMVSHLLHCKKFS